MVPERFGSLSIWLRSAGANVWIAERADRALVCGRGQFLTTSFENHARRSWKLHFHDMWTICHFLFLTTVIRGIFIYLLMAGRWHVAWACTYACDGVRVPMVRIVYHVCACVYLGISTRVWVYPFFCLLFVIFLFIYTYHHGTFV